MPEFWSAHLWSVGYLTSRVQYRMHSFPRTYTDIYGCVSVYTCIYFILSRIRQHVRILSTHMYVFSILTFLYT
jgi:hypothetical protein